MKKALLTISIVVVLAVGLSTASGCKTHKIQVIESTDVVTNNVPLKAFNDDIYIWERWTTGTNRVDSVDKLQ